MANKIRRGQGTGALFKRADGYWVGQVSISGADGKRRRKSVSSKDRNTAAQKLKDLRKQIDAGMLPSTGHTTVAKWCQKWLEEIRGPHVDPSTYTFYEKNIRLYIVPEVGGRRLDRLTPEDVRQMTRHLNTKSTRSAQNAWRVLRMALADAMKEGLISRNVVTATNKPKHFPKEGTALSWEEARRVMDLAKASRDEMLEIRVDIAMSYGTRPSELLGLRWEYVDLTGGEIRLEWQLQRLSKVHGCGGTCGRAKPGFCPDAKWKVPPAFEMQECQGSLAFTRPKTQRGTRAVVLVEHHRLLLTHLKSMDGENPHGLVFHHDDGRPISPEDDWKAWSALFEQAGIDATRYASRHTAGTLMQSLGVAAETRMAIMGHSSAAAQEAYIHPAQSSTRLALEEYTGRLNEPTAPKPTAE